MARYADSQAKSLGQEPSRGPSELANLPDFVRPEVVECLRSLLWTSDGSIVEDPIKAIYDYIELQGIEAHNLNITVNHSLLRGDVAKAKEELVETEEICEGIFSTCVSLRPLRDFGYITGEDLSEYDDRLREIEYKSSGKLAVNHTLIALLESDDYISSLEYEEKLRLLEDHARHFGPHGLGDYHKILFPELQNERTAAASPSLPSEAPEKYSGLRGPETPPEFVKRVYAPWLGHGLTRAHIRKLDPGLSQAITNWLRHNEWPAEVDLPTLKEQNTRWVERLDKEGLGALLPTDSPEAALREGRRLATLKHRRTTKDTSL